MGLSGSPNVDALSALLQLGSGLFEGRALNMEQTAQYVEDNRLDDAALVWNEGRLTLSEEQWGLVQILELNVFYDDGEGYLDLGLDNSFELDETSGALLARGGDSWLAINGQPVAYYHTATVDDGTNYTITGRVPVLHNGQRAELILVFDDDRPKGYIAGARYVYKGGETDTVAKSTVAVGRGDQLDFLCDYYSYDGTYQDSYYLGDPMVLKDDIEIGNVDIGGKAKVTYKLTDIYQQSYWTPEVPEK